MSTTYLNRLLVIGTPGRVNAFRDTMRLTLKRRVGQTSWDEQVPFSLERLAAVTRMRGPGNYVVEPYSMSAWPIRQVTARRAEIRYQFETIDLEMPPPIKRLSRHMPDLTFRLMMHCLDDDCPQSFEMRAGALRKRSLSDDQRQQYWQAAGEKCGLSGDAIYDDDVATFIAEEQMREDVLNVWVTGKAPRRNWWNRPKRRLLMDEKEWAVIDLEEPLVQPPSRKTSRR